MLFRSRARQIIAGEPEPATCLCIALKGKKWFYILNGCREKQVYVAESDSCTRDCMETHRSYEEMLVDLGSRRQTEDLWYHP